MKKLLNTLYITSEDAYLSLENDNVVVWQEDVRKAQYPLLMLEGISSFSYKGASPALMGKCAETGISLCFMTRNGRFLARVCGADRGNVLLRKTQYRLSDSEKESCRIARHFIFGKLYNSRWQIERTLRDHAMRVDETALRTASRFIDEQGKLALGCCDLEVLRGIEGKASERYFSVFDQMILNQKDAFVFDARSRRPPTDPVNAMLSFLYTVLAHDCAAALESVGLDAYVGFMHRDRPGRASLALDMMEELRAPMADRLVLTLINTRAVHAGHFQRQAGGMVLMTDEGRKLILKAWQARKLEEITHPFLKERLAWGLVPYAQSLLLARHLRGDLDGYPPFLWK